MIPPNYLFSFTLAKTLNKCKWKRAKNNKAGEL